MVGFITSYDVLRMKIENAESDGANIEFHKVGEYGDKVVAKYPNGRTRILGYSSTA